MKRKRLSLSILLTAFTIPPVAFADAINDLSPFQSVKLDVVLRTIDGGDRNPGIFYDIANTYTNSIVCAVDVAIPVTKNGVEGVFEVSQNDVVIFPNGAFDKAISYRIDASRIPNDRTIQPGVTTRFTGAAACTGWTLGKRLPRKTCLALVPNHNQVCILARAAGKDYYPVVRHDAHVGDCGC